MHSQLSLNDWIIMAMETVIILLQCCLLLHDNIVDVAHYLIDINLLYNYEGGNIMVHTYMHALHCIL